MTFSPSKLAIAVSSITGAAMSAAISVMAMPRLARGIGGGGASGSSIRRGRGQSVPGSVWPEGRTVDSVSATSVQSSPVHWLT